jgi:hypothetical protein
MTKERRLGMTKERRLGMTKEGRLGMTRKRRLAMTTAACNDNEGILGMTKDVGSEWQEPRSTNVG